MWQRVFSDASRLYFGNKTGLSGDRNSIFWKTRSQTAIEIQTHLSNSMFLPRREQAEQRNVPLWQLEELAVKLLPVLLATLLLSVGCGAREVPVETLLANRGSDPAAAADRNNTDDYPSDKNGEIDHGKHEDETGPHVGQGPGHVQDQHPNQSGPSGTSQSADHSEKPHVGPKPNPSDSQPKPVPSPSPIPSPKPNSDANSMFKLLENFELPEPELKDEKESLLWATYYYLPEVNAADAGFALLSVGGKELGPKISKKDWCNAAMEGSIRVKFEDRETTYNYAGVNDKQQVDCSEYFPHNVGGTRFKPARGAFGDGVRNYRLIPFRTIAVDSKVIPYGSVVYIAEARGVRIVLSDGTEVVHDGYFFAGDTGGAIKTNHIDVFIGVAKKNPFSWVKSNSKKTFPAYVQKTSDVSQALEKYHTSKYMEEGL